jgi:RNA polymerase sigma-70 factor (ECF subfamily)
MPDRSAIKAWFTHRIGENMDALYGTALRLTRKPADAEDLVADCVEKAWRSIDSLKDRQRFRPWIFRILHNNYISEYRKQSVRPDEVAFEETPEDDKGYTIVPWLNEQPDEFLKWWAQPETAFFKELVADSVVDALQALPEVFRVTILLVNVEGLTYDEAAEALGVPPGTVRSRMKRGRTMLQKALWQHAQDHGGNGST